MGHDRGSPFDKLRVTGGDEGVGMTERLGRLRVTRRGAQPDR
jgi:hypothetical protein